jgi:hypothetical protein
VARQQSYAEQLGDTLRRRDPRRLQAFLIDNARRFGDARQVAEVAGKSPEEMAGLMHRMILARADLKDLHAASRDWLAKHADGRG